VDVNNCPPELLDKLFEANYNLWGGRYNVLVPVKDGVITESYWKLLSFVDPDVLYSFTDLNAAVVTRLDRELCPTKMERHREFPTGGSRNYYPSVCHEQVAIDAVFPQALSKKSTLAIRKPKLLTSAASRQWAHRREGAPKLWTFSKRSWPESPTQKIRR